jgi:uncharacterized protein YukJ
MPLPQGYAVLKGHAIAGVPAQAGQDHYSVHVIDDRVDYRVAVNIRSSAPGFGTDLFFYLDEDFQHPLLDAVRGMPLGRKLFAANTSATDRRTSGVALDFIRMNLFDRTQMQIFPAQLPGANNDLNDRVDGLVQDMIGDERNVIYAFGDPWINEQKKDKVFGFFPGNGVHDIHMNQGDLTGKFSGDDGVYQDGGLLFYYAAKDKFVAYFTKFQSESWHTDDATGHAISGGGDPVGPDGHGHPGHGGGNPIGPGGDPDFRVRIVAALVNPTGPAPEKETVTLLNTTAQPIDLGGWGLLDRNKNKMPLTGTVAAGDAVRVAVQAPLQLSNNGGLITLLNKQGVKVHGVSYTAAQAQPEGMTLVFGA